MKTITVNAEREYRVEIGVNWQASLKEWVKDRNKVVLIKSENLAIQTDYPTINIPDGEAGKSPEVLVKVWQSLGELEINRQDLIIGIGGGTVTDFAGFVAATWLRGVDWVAIPTTLAGMVDAAVGGKTGINSKHGKNLIGAFHSPCAVLIDLNWIKSLTERDVAAGMAEVVKCGFISDLNILDLFENNSVQEIYSNQELQLQLIHRAVAVKAQVVNQDFKESFLREILNYGHTLGHAIERHSNYQLRHGEAIAIGMCFAAELSTLVNGLDAKILEQHYRILGGLGLPTNYQLNAWPELLELMSLDKKIKNGKVRFVGLEELGKCNRIESASDQILRSAYERICR